MADKSKIEWTDATWNPVVGCSVVSPGCTNCYAMKQAARIEAMNEGAHRASVARDPEWGALALTHYAGLTQPSKAGAVWTGKVALAPDHVLTAPLRWKRARRIFVNSMGDLFHEAIPDEWIDRVFAVMALCPQHTFQVLTKRAKRMRSYFEGLTADRQELAQDSVPLTDAQAHDLVKVARTLPLPNVWLGVSAEDQTRADERIPDLLATPAAVRFVSAEPLLSVFNLTPWLTGHEDNGIVIDADGWHPGGAVDWTPPLDWVICGGESGIGARPMHPDWARAIVDQCRSAGVACFVKQLSGPRGKPIKEMVDFPDDLRVREFPEPRRG